MHATAPGWPRSSSLRSPDAKYILRHAQMRRQRSNSGGGRAQIDRPISPFTVHQLSSEGDEIGSPYSYGETVTGGSEV
jgi:hypothetical protein